MKILYQDLINYLSEKPSKELLSEKLFQLGHEHEIYGDIFDMELTPNRGDCISLNGLARDLHVFFGKSAPIKLFEGDLEPLEINFENLSPTDCPQISFLEIEIEEVTDSYRPYLENYLVTSGSTKTNFFTDISNFISYELGQPTHCFDRETINNKLIFENKECNNTFETLLGSEVTLKDHNCVFTKDGEIISLAGVMGGMSTACSVLTKKVLVECAYFNPEAVIGKSVKYNLNSDAAYKFERGVDINAQEKTLRRFIKVVQDHADIKKVKIKTFSEIEYKHSFMPIDVCKINKILGTGLDELAYIKYLERIGFEITNQIKIPSYRHDIETQNDLAEEIARVIGYDKIISSTLPVKKNLDKKSLTKVKYIESLLIKNGFAEVINYPFTSRKEQNSISIDNPLDSNRANFRISLKDSLIENLIYNERRQKDSIKLFEISDIYTKDSKLNQLKKLGIIASGRVGNNYDDFSKKLDQKYLNQLLNSNTTDEIFQINEIPRSSIDSKKKEKIFYVEITIDHIPDNFFLGIEDENRKINFIAYKPVSEFPSSTRDFSFSITNISMLNKVIELLNETKDNILKDSFMFDFYKDHKSNSIKLGYRFVFQSYSKTLSEIEINNKVKEILEPVLKLDGVSVPGMA